MSITKAGEFEKKLMRYALAGTSVLGLPMVSQANIPGITQSGTITSTGTPVGLPISFDNAAFPDFTLFATAGPTQTGIYVGALIYGQTGDSFSGPVFGGPTDAGLFPTAFASASSVTASSMTGIKIGILSKTTSGVTYGNFPVGGNAYLGVIFQIGGGLYLGDIEVALQNTLGDNPSSTITVLSTSYDPTPLSSTPEPSSLPLYALGAAGLAIAMKRRKAARAALNC